jgi:hypothetical protein
MKAAQEAAKAQKHLQRKEKIIFFKYSRKRQSLQLFFMRIIYCNGKKGSKLIILFLVLEHQYLNTKRRFLLLSVVSFFIYPVRCNKRMPLHQGYPKIVCSQSRF